MKSEYILIGDRVLILDKKWLIVAFVATVALSSLAVNSILSSIDNQRYARACELMQETKTQVRHVQNQIEWAGYLGDQLIDDSETLGGCLEEIRGGDE